jgi:hypothetical protein|tara:strand:- start:6272 stop:10150 length:3879 start_codon:yes stop_codon:yes gene_type:complete
MSDPRKSNGQINPKFKRLINEELDNLTRKIKIADKDYKKVAALTSKATKASQKEGADKEKIKKQLKVEIERRKNARDKANRDEDIYKDKLAKRLVKQNIGLLITKSNKAFINDLFTKEGRGAYLKNSSVYTDNNFTPARVRQMDKRYSKAEKVYQSRKAAKITKEQKYKKRKLEEYHSGVKTSYIFDFEDFNDDPSVINQMIINIRRAIDNTKWRHPKAKFNIRLSSESNPFDDRYAFSLPTFAEYTKQEVLDILEDKMERALEEYDEEDDERFDFVSLGISFITEPNKIIGAGGHKTIQMAHSLWFICGSTSKSNCFYRSISFVRLMKDLNKDKEKAATLLGEDDRELLQKINERSKQIKRTLKQNEDISRKTTTEDDIQKWVDNNYKGGKRGSANKCEVAIYNSVFCKIKTIRPTEYTGGSLITYEVWCINHHFIPLVRWYELINIKEICDAKLMIDKEKEKKSYEANKPIKKHIATEIVNDSDYKEWLWYEKNIDADTLKGFDRIKYERIYKYQFKSDESKVRRQINPMNNKIATYDFEATPNGNGGKFITYRASLAYNVLDEKDQFVRIEHRTFGGKSSIRKMMKWLFDNKRMMSGYTLYAHNAGKFDLLLILGEYLLENEEYWSIDTESLIVLNGAYLNVILFNEEGDDTHTLALKDSYRLLPGSLDKLCKEFDVPHKKLSGAVDFNEMNIMNCFGGYVKDKKPFSSDLFRLELGNVVYCNWDVIGLLEVMNKFKIDVYENMDNINITDCLTGASLSKKNYFLSYYDGINMPIYSMNEKYDEFCRKGYFGGRNEAFYVGEYIGKTYYNDFTSLYPDVGRKRLPYGKPKRWTKAEVEKWNDRLKSGKSVRPIVGIVRVIAKTKNFDLLPLHAIKSEGKLMFPLLEKPTELYLWYNELLYGKELDQYEYELLDAISFGEEVFGIKKKEKETFWENGVLSDFFNDAFDKKGKAKADGKLALAQCYKIVANSGYGFWGLNARGDNNEGRDGMEILKCDDDSFWDLIDKGYVSNMNRVGNYTLVRTSKPMPVKDFNVAIAAAICSEARIKIHKFMNAISKVGKILYCDTDSCISNVDMTEYPEMMKEFCWDGYKDPSTAGDDLGSMKNECVEKLEKYFGSKVMKENPLLDERMDKPVIKKMIKKHMEKQLEADRGDYYFDKGIIAGCKQYCLHKTTYDGGHIEASAAKGVARKLEYGDFHHLLYGSRLEEQKEYEELIKEEKPDWTPPEGYRIYERQYQFRSGLISHINGDIEIIKTPVDKAMRINYLKGLCEGGEIVNGIDGKGFVKPLRY